MSNEQEITLKDIHEDLRELLKWAKFSGMKEVKPILESKLDSDVKKIVYVLSDGNKSTRVIERLINAAISNRSVSNYWKDWEEIGLGTSIPIGGGNRFKHSFNLQDFGIEVPTITIESQSTQNEPEVSSSTESTNEQ